MAITTHEIDPNPDAIIILKNPIRDFAPWDEPVTIVESTQSIDERASARETSGESTDGLSSVGHESSKTDEPVKRLDTAGPRIEAEDGDVCYLVSSRHLVLASPCFKRMLLNDAWVESSRDPSDGLLRIAASDWDEEAFLIVLNILHLRNRSIPRAVNLDTLARIAVIVDYYESYEAVDLFRDMWIKNIREESELPSTYCRDLILWIWISWVFDLAKEFRKTTLTAILCNTEPIRSFELPLPTLVTDRIDNVRYAAMNKIIEELHKLLAFYQSSEYECPRSSSYSFQCGSFLLGILMKELDSKGLLSPMPQVPFTGLSFQDLCDKACSIRSLNWHNDGGAWRNGSFVRCNLVEKVIPLVNKIEGSMTGLELKELRNGNSSG